LNDGDAGSDDFYDISVNGISTGGIGPAGGLITFNVGSGEDTLALNRDLSGDVDIDFGSWISGYVTVTNFRADNGGDRISFDGLPGITANVVNPAIANSVAVTSVNSNTIYFVDDGDVAVTGTTGGALDGADIADYTNLTDVANYLNAVTDGSAGVNDSAVFLVSNGTVVTTTPGDDRETYIYLFNDNGGGAGIQADELTLIATIDLSPLSGQPLSGSVVI
jgi:hypothetical protein